MSLSRDINDLADMQKMMLGMVEDQGRDINVFGVYTILPCKVKVIHSFYCRGQCGYCSKQSRKRKEGTGRGKAGLLVQE